MNDDQGHDHVHHGARDCGCGEGGQGHVEVDGIVKDEVRGEEEEENCPGEGGRTEERNIWYLGRCYTVSHHKPDMVSMYDTVFSEYYTL